MNDWRTQTLNLDRSRLTSFSARSLARLIVLGFLITTSGSAEAYDSELYGEQPSSIASGLSSLVSDDSSPSPEIA